MSRPIDRVSLKPPQRHATSKSYHCLLRCLLCSSLLYSIVPQTSSALQAPQHTVPKHLVHRPDPPDQQLHQPSVPARRSRSLRPNPASQASMACERRNAGLSVLLYVLKTKVLVRPRDWTGDPGRKAGRCILVMAWRRDNVGIVVGWMLDDMRMWDLQGRLFHLISDPLANGWSR